MVGDRLFDNSSCCDCDCQLRIHSLLPLIPASKQWGELLCTWKPHPKYLTQNNKWIREKVQFFLSFFLCYCFRVSKDTAAMHSPCAISHKFTKTLIHFLQLGRSSLLQGVVTPCPSLCLRAAHTIMRSTPSWYRVSLTVGGWESTLPMTCDRCEDSVLQVRVTADFTVATRGQYNAVIYIGHRACPNFCQGGRKGCYCCYRLWTCTQSRSFEHFQQIVNPNCCTTRPQRTNKSVGVE